MAAAANTATRTVRRLGIGDLERVVAIDRAHTGRSRRHFFEKRMTAAQERPADFIHVGTMWGDALCGFAIARILRGEFGREHAVAVLDALGVEPETQECGIGHALMEELIKAMREMGIRSLQSQVDWANQDLLRFLQASDFKIAPRLALERSVVERLDETIEDV